MSFDEYITHGWRLCPIPFGHKGPRDLGWNKPGTPQATIPPGWNAGLMHVESHTCAIDIDKLDVAQPWLNARGVELASLLNAPSAVRISSGRSGRAKLLYRLSAPLVSLKTAPFKARSQKSGKEETYTALDFRCATKGGLSMQDVLPPSIHPDTGAPYRWEYGDDLTGSWRNLPELPTELRAVWESLLSSQIANDAPAAPSGATFDEIRTLIAQQDPNAAYNEWLRVGMAIHHETGGSRDGLLLWNEWSAQATGPDKYKGLADLEPHWRSFSATAAGAVTLGSLRAEAVAGVSDFPVVPASTAKRKFQRRSFQEFISGKPPEWIVDGIIPAATVGAVYGASGSGKSFLVADLGLHVAEGRTWRGQNVRKGRVVYLVAEGVAGSRQRLTAARDELGFDVSGFEVIEDTPNLLNKEDPPALARELQAPDEEGHPAKIDLVIVDTLAQTTPGADENSGKDMSVALEHCKLIHQATGAMVLLIAHAGKDESRGLRGWSGIRAALDCEIEVTDTQPNTPGSLRIAKVTKMKDGEEGAEYPFRLRVAGKSCVIDHTDEKPRAKVSKYRPGSPEDLIRQVYPTLAPMGTGQGVAAYDLIAAIVDRMAPETPDRRADRIGKALNSFCNKPGSMLRIQGNMVFPVETNPSTFDLRPVAGAAGIDVELPLRQDHSDLLGVQ